MIMLPSQHVASAATITRPSSSAYFDSNRLGPCGRSPIRTLSEDRVHVSLRLGPLFSEEENVDGDRTEDTPQLIMKDSSKAPSKAEGKRVVDITQARKPTNNITDQGAEVKRRRVTKTHNSPRRNSPRAKTKLLADAIRTGTRVSTRKKNTSTAPKIKFVPGIARKEKDFHPLPSSLP